MVENIYNQPYFSRVIQQNAPILIEGYNNIQNQNIQPINVSQQNQIYEEYTSSQPIQNYVEYTSSQPVQNVPITIVKHQTEPQQIQNPQLISVREYSSTAQPNHTQQISIDNSKSISQPKQKQSVTIGPYDATPRPNTLISGINQSSFADPVNIKSNINGNANLSMISEKADESIITHPIDTPQSFAQSIIHELNKVNMQQNNNQQNIIKKSLMGRTPGPMPVYNLIRKGNGINPTEQQGIIFSAMKVLQEDMIPLSNNTAKLIKKKIGGDWLVIVYEEGKAIDFNLTYVEGSDFMYFNLDKIAYQVCRIR